MINLTVIRGLKVGVLGSQSYYEDLFRGSVNIYVTINIEIRLLCPENMALTEELIFKLFADFSEENLNLSNPVQNIFE